MKKEKYFSPIFTFAATWCQEKKAKKKLPPPSENIHTIEFFLATLNSKIKKNEFSCPKKMKYYYLQWEKHYFKDCKSNFP